MTMLDHHRPAPVIYLPCGVARSDYARVDNPLTCVLPMGHEGAVSGDDSIHRDRMGRTWENPVRFIHRQRHALLVERLVVSLQSTLDVLDRVGADAGCLAPTMVREIAQSERHRVLTMLQACGLTLTREESPR